MAPQFSLSSSGTVFLILFSLSSLYYICHAHYSPSSEKLQSPLDFLKDLNGTHKGDLAKGLSELKKYLANLGYIDPNSIKTLIHRNDDFYDDTLESAIKKYQEFHNLKITGLLDEETVESLQRPRCGVADFHSRANLTTSFLHTDTDMGSLYTFLGTKWPPSKRYLTFSYPKNTRRDANVPVAKALIKWMSVSPFRFAYRDDFGKVDIKISFERRDHGDGYPFDGPNGVLAHAFSPTDGRLHFDAEENWRSYVEKGAYDLQTIALHELGHILGLAHTPNPKALMYPYFEPGERKDLNEDDIRGIRALYPK